MADTTMTETGPYPEDLQPISFEDFIQYEYKNGLNLPSKALTFLVIYFYDPKKKYSQYKQKPCFVRLCSEHLALCRQVSDGLVSFLTGHSTESQRHDFYQNLYAAYCIMRKYGISDQEIFRYSPELSLS